ncbi:MAG: helix-turn-helix domain-containing protein [Acidimicrobiales bacterium]|nr:helix-turn-helix domain-containing protein [Acidimicrobiales bacterium]
MRRRTAADPTAPTAPLIDIAEAAQRLGVSVRFMRRLVDERRIPFHKIGRYVRFDPADIDRFVMQGRVEPIHA